ncbi:MAG TPA: serine/threonine-protein kinase [Nannocystaceae bacterium]|nr:serine/threonine-protein kinase [Nannocystaceae bacterium]
MQPQRDPLLASIVGGRYRLLQRIAATEMSLVYRAVDQTSNQRVAVKLLHASRENLAERCLREAAAMAALQSPHVVRALDFGRTDTGHVFLTMEYLAGENLAETLRREGPLPWPRVIHIGRQLCEALLATHAAGIIHRDVKPANCMRLATAQDPDFVKLLDFGISKNLDRSLPSLTGTGVVLGTPAYMAPELIATGSPTIASDIYALGATLYQLTTGALPFAGQTALDFYYHHQFSPLIAASQRLGRALPPALDDLFTIAMAKEAGQRFADIAAIRAALDALAPAAAPALVGEDSLEVRPTRPFLPANADLLEPPLSRG